MIPFQRNLFDEMAHTPVRVIEDVFMLNRNTKPPASPVLIAVLFQETKTHRKNSNCLHNTVYLEIVGS